MNEASVFVLVGAVAFISGLRGSIRLHRRYIDVRKQLLNRERLLLASIVIVCWLITVTGGLLVVLTGRRLMGFTPFEWGATVTLLFAVAILFIPAFFDYIVARVARVPWK